MSLPPLSWPTAAWTDTTEVIPGVVSALLSNNHGSVWDAYYDALLESSPEAASDYDGHAMYALDFIIDFSDPTPGSFLEFMRMQSGMCFRSVKGGAGYCFFEWNFNNLYSTTLYPEQVYNMSGPEPFLAYGAD